MSKELSRAQLETTLIRAAWESKEFKKKLLTEPKKALADLGYTLSEEIEISVLEEHRNKMIFVLPANPLGSMQEFIPTAVNPTAPGGPGAVTMECAPPGGVTLGEECSLTKGCKATLPINCHHGSEVPSTKPHECKPGGPASPQPPKK